MYLKIIVNHHEEQNEFLLHLKIRGETSLDESNRAVNQSDKKSVLRNISNHNIRHLNSGCKTPANIET